MANEEKGYWFSTENGTHIHAEEGESKEQAMSKKFSNFGKGKKEEKGLKTESRTTQNEMQSNDPDKLADKLDEKQNRLSKYNDEQIKKAYINYAMPDEELDFDEEGNIIDLNYDNSIITPEDMRYTIENWLDEGVSEEDIFGDDYRKTDKLEEQPKEYRPITNFDFDKWQEENDNEKANNLGWDGFVTAPIVNALEKNYGRTLENKELKEIIEKKLAENPNATTKEFENILMSAKPEETKELNNTKIENYDNDPEVEKESQDIISSGKKYTYMMLDRMRSDLEYALGTVAETRKNHPEWFAPNSDKISDFHSIWWSEKPYKQIALMRKLHNSLKEKPEWLTMEQINDFEKRVKEHLGK